jgi:hypothetical protein
MSVILRTISAFPRGRRAEELLVLLDADFDPDKRRSIIAELGRLAEQGLVRRALDGRWSAIPSRTNRAGTPAPPTGRDARAVEVAHSGLIAAPAQFRESPTAGPTPDADDAQAGTAALDPAKLIRYWRAALRADPRGAITQTDDRHGVSWHLVTGRGPMAPTDGGLIEIAIALDNLSDEFRKALLRREANEQTLAVGWPIAVGRKAGVPVVWPVGLLPAEWRRTDDALTVIVEADDIAVNPDWLKGAAQASGWSEAALRDVFSVNQGEDLRLEDFSARLKEAAAGTVHGPLTGRMLAGGIDLGRPGVFNIAGLFLPTDTTFTSGAVKDLDAIAAWSPETLARTALGAVLGWSQEETTPSAPALNVGSLNAEQIAAVRNACTAPVSTVTGPPGTGKSQAIVSIAASILAHGGSVLVASKNHQALDAVEDRLGGMAPDAPFVVRTLNPTRQIDVSFKDALEALLKEPPRPTRPLDGALLDALPKLAEARAMALDDDDRRNALHLEIADLLERLETRERLGVGGDPSTRAAAKRVRFWRIALSAIATLFRRSQANGGSPPSPSEP